MGYTFQRRRIVKQVFGGGAWDGVHETSVCLHAVWVNFSVLTDNGGVYSRREFHVANKRARFRCNPSAGDVPTEIYGHGRKASGPRAASPEGRYFPISHLDMIGIVGRPLRPITSRSGFFDNVTFTLRYWHTSYAGKHVSTKLPFDLRNRTFRIATAACCEVWFIVMHPVQSQMDDLSGSHGQRRRQKASRQSSAVERHYAEALAEFIIEIFTDGEPWARGLSHRRA